MPNKNLLNMLVIISVSLLSACVPPAPPPPAISDISNADSLVRVQAQNIAGEFPEWPSEESILKEGQRGCDQFQKPAVMLSSRCIYSKPGVFFEYCVTKEYLFACRISKDS